MPDKFKIATAILAAIVAYDTHITLTKIKPAAYRLIEENTDLRELLAESYARSGYLASIIDEHEIGLDEFDLIAINNPM